MGTNALSYRVETEGCLNGDQEFVQFLAYLSQFWDTHKREMLWLRNINGLQKTLQFIDGTKTKTSGDGDHLPLEHLACKIRKLLTSENSFYSVPKNLQMVIKKKTQNFHVMKINYIPNMCGNLILFFSTLIQNGFSNSANLWSQ